MLKKDLWLSGYLLCPVFHLDDFVRLEKNDLPAGKAFIDTKVGVQDIEKITVLENLGFRLIDTNVQLIRKAGAFEKTSTRCRFANPADENAVRMVAGNSFVQSRFHLDPVIPNSVADKIKEDWAGNFFSAKRGKWMVVVEHDKKVCGFLQLLQKNEETIIIDLIAVAKDKQGLGLGGEMISFASSACLNKEARMEVGTQVANLSSLSLYTNLGFRISDFKYVLHLHQ